MKNRRIFQTGNRCVVWACCWVMVLFGTELRAESPGSAQSHQRAQQLADDRKEEYVHALGGRFGVANGITYKRFINDYGHAIDALLNFRGNRSYGLFKLTGLYALHDRIAVFDYEGFLWYYGAGGGLGIHTDRRQSNAQSLALSADGVVGIDFKIPTAPINISLDWKPSLELSPHPALKVDGFGLSVRFVLD